MTSTRDKQEVLEKLRDSLSDCGAWLVEPFDPSHPTVRLHEPTYGIDEVVEVVESLLTTRVTMGEKVRRFEQAFADEFGFRHAVMVNSGSSANLLAVASLTNPALPPRLQAGDEVIVPALCWSTTVWPLIQHGLIPVFVDIDPKSMNLDPNEVQRAIGPRTKGLVAVHVYGNPCPMDAIMSVVSRHNLVLIEDCCEALGATYGGRSVGSFGPVNTFSFYFSHHMTTIEGGMCVTDDDRLAELLRILRAHGWVRDVQDQQPYLQAQPDLDPRFLFANVGYNFRPTELQGGFGCVQLKKLNQFLDVRAANAAFWRHAMAPWASWFEFQEPTPGGTSSWFGFPMAIKPSAPFSRSELRSFLDARGIETRPIAAGNLAEQPAMRYYRHRTAGGLSHATFVMRNGFTFGNHQAIGEAARTHVVEAFQAFLRTRGLI